MDQGLIVFFKIIALFLLIVVGWAARRRKYLTAETTSTVSLFVVDLTFPALVLTEMLRLDRAELAASWYYPLLGVAVIVIGELVGLITMDLFCKKGGRGTFVFLIAIANWIYLPLPILQGLHGDAGVRAVVLFNVGVMAALWTMGVWTLRGGKPNTAAIRGIITNPGLLATITGVALVLVFPGLHSIASSPNGPIGARFAGAVVEALVMLGSLTIPLSLIVTGAQLGGLPMTDHRPSSSLAGVLVSRLFLAPAATIALVQLAGLIGWALPDVPRMTMYIIAATPVAISCSIFTERFGGDTSLAARSIFYSTFLSILTTPIIVLLVGWLHL